jgi:hypothetical protein
MDNNDSDEDNISNNNLHPFFTNHFSLSRFKLNNSSIRSKGSTKSMSNRGSFKMPNGENNRMMIHRPSVRSVSENLNVIGMQELPIEYDFCTYLLTALSWSLIIAFFPLSLMVIFHVIQEYERGIYSIEH